MRGSSHQGSVHTVYDSAPSCAVDVPRPGHDPLLTGYAGFARTHPGHRSEPTRPGHRTLGSTGVRLFQREISQPLVRLKSESMCRPCQVPVTRAVAGPPD